MAIKVITIDFWNTLFDSSGGTQRNDYRLQTLLNVMGNSNQEITNEDFHQAMSASWESFNYVWLNENRTLETIESVKCFMNFLKLDYTESQLDTMIRCFAESVLVYPPQLIKGVPEGLEKISKKYKLGIVSDSGFSPGTILRQLLEQTGIIKYFSTFSFSDETKVSKPHPKAYLTVLDKFNCSPEDSLHIGDIEVTDIKGAKALGMQAIRFTGDKTAPMNMKNPQTSQADYEFDSWDDIVKKLTIGKILNSELKKLTPIC